MNKSKISDHKRVKKELITPWNYLMGDKLELRSWYKERCPEYLWLVGIVDKYGRKEGLKLCYHIIEYIVNNSLKVDSLALSNIIKLNNPNLYDFINKLIGKDHAPVHPCVALAIKGQAVHDPLISLPGGLVGGLVGRGQFKQQFHTYDHSFPKMAEARVHPALPEWQFRFENRQGTEPPVWKKPELFSDLSSQR